MKSAKNRRREPLLKPHTGGWGKTAKNIELYSSAYRIAWRDIPLRHRREQPDIALRLHASIRRQLMKGITDPRVIATEALKTVSERIAGTPTSQES
jgi:hypothetical protein